MEGHRQFHRCHCELSPLSSLFRASFSSLPVPRARRGPEKLWEEGSLITAGLTGRFFLSGSWADLEVGNKLLAEYLARGRPGL